MKPPPPLLLSFLVPILNLVTLVGLVWLNQRLTDQNKRLLDLLTRCTGTVETITGYSRETFVPIPNEPLKPGDRVQIQKGTR